MFEKPGQLTMRDPDVPKKPPHGLLWSEPTSQQVKGNPSPFIFEIRLILKDRRAERFPEVFGLYELRIRIHFANRAHCEDRCLALIEQRPSKHEIRPRMRKPMS